ncbi:MAG: hypothetical protein JWR13_4393 [Mycobacterium sp.]|nr:hypothetical protein [Mycobacterium sp.]
MPMESMIEPAKQAAEDFVTEQPEPSADVAAVLLGAVDAARTAIKEYSGDDVVGEYLGASFDDPTAATHRFLAAMPGYQGWQWAVVVAAYPGADHATISEVVLVPGPTALLAPQWVPWQERVQPGDLSPGDLLATPADDPRLVPGHVSSGDEELDDLAAEIGLGKRQVLSQWGRIEAAERWHDGEYGPDSAMARATRKVCRDCAYYLSLAGSLGRLFGVCANEMSADGHVVASEYGCGAHSDTPQPATIGSPMFDPFDDGVLDLARPVAAEPAPAEAEPVAAEPEPVAAEPEPVAAEPVEPVDAEPEPAAAEAVDAEPSAEG